jgi:hypothetical protein
LNGKSELDERALEMARAIFEDMVERAKAIRLRVLPTETRSKDLSIKTPAQDLCDDLANIASWAAHLERRAKLTKARDARQNPARQPGDQAFDALFSELIMIWFDIFRSTPGASTKAYGPRASRVYGPFPRFIQTYLRLLTKKLGPRTLAQFPELRPALNPSGEAIRARLKSNTLPSFLKTILAL